MAESSKDSAVIKPPSYDLPPPLTITHSEWRQRLRMRRELRGHPSREMSIRSLHSRKPPAYYIHCLIPPPLPPVQRRARLWRIQNCLSSIRQRIWMRSSLERYQASTTTIPYLLPFNNLSSSHQSTYPPQLRRSVYQRRSRCWNTYTTRT